MQDSQAHLSQSYMQHQSFQPSHHGAAKIEPHDSSFLDISHDINIAQPEADNEDEDDMGEGDNEGDDGEGDNEGGGEREGDEEEDGDEGDDEEEDEDEDEFENHEV